MLSTEEMIQKAKETSGGHLTVGRGGYTLHIEDGHTLSGYDIDRVKQLCIDCRAGDLRSDGCRRLSAAFLYFAGLLLRFAERMGRVLSRRRR